jgi:hypothetical protein
MEDKAMTERIMMLIIALVVILILSWGVTAMASSFNAAVPTVAHHDIDKSALHPESDTTDIILDASRVDGIPEGLRKAETEEH